MTDYEENTIKPLRRAHILGFLETRKDYVSTADILVTVINGTRDGLTAYYSDVIADLAWLETKGYVRLSGEDFVVVEATARGLRIARDQDRDDGIARPGPRG